MHRRVYPRDQTEFTASNPALPSCVYQGTIEIEILPLEKLPYNDTMLLNYKIIIKSM